jgi:hypothetical protein
MQLELSAVPLDGVSEALWLHGEAGDPAVGDLWLLSWDGRALGLALISGIADDYVLVWPVALPSDVVFRPAVQVPESPLGVPLVIWPSRETGVGNHMLHRRFGTLLREDVMAAVAEAAEQGSEGPLPYAPATERNRIVDSADEAMVDQWEDICLNVWPRPRPGASPLNRDSLRAHGVRPSDLAEVLSLSGPDAVALFNGEMSLDAQRLELIESRMGISAAELLDPMMDDAARELLSPVWKDDILAVAEHFGEDELSAREELREEYALAARSTGDQAARMRAAIQRLLGRPGR